MKELRPGTSTIGFLVKNLAKNLGGGNFFVRVRVIAFLVVNFFGFLVIIRNHTMRFGPKLEEIFL